jgi:hypothetical protein
MKADDMRRDEDVRGFRSVCITTKGFGTRKSEASNLKLLMYGDCLVKGKCEGSLRYSFKGSYVEILLV